MNRYLAWGIAGCLAIAVAAYGAYHLGMDRGMGMTQSADTGASGKAPSPPERKVLYWYDPMVPGQRFDKPGKSPFMDMQLVPLYADEGQGRDVSVSPAMTQNLGLRTAVVRKAPLTTTVEAAGTVTQNERSTVVVQSRTAGYVERQFVRATLDPVAQGQELATIYAPDWAGALSEYLALRKANIDPTILTAAKERLRLLSIPDDVVGRSEREGTAQTRFTLTSPTAGVVAELGAREGAMVQPGMALYRIVDLSSVWIEAHVTEAQSADVRVGALAHAKAAAYPERVFSGKVSALLPQVDPATRTLRARLEVANPGTVLKPGMFVTVSISSGQPQQALVVPQEAVIATGKRNVVVVARENGRFEPVEVTLGRPVGSDVEVKSGLAEGQRVVTSSQFLIDSEASLKAVLPRLEAGTAATAASPRVYRGEGRVERVGKEELTLSHGPIPALQWPPMTMGFRNPASGIPQGLKNGDNVQFEFIEDSGTYQLTRIERAGSKP